VDVVSACVGGSPATLYWSVNSGGGGASRFNSTAPNTVGSAAITADSRGFNVIASDLDADGDADVVLASGSGVAVFLNQRGTPTALFSAAVVLVGAGGSTCGLTAVDVDADGACSHAWCAVSSTDCWPFRMSRSLIRLLPVCCVARLVRCACGSLHVCTLCTGTVAWLTSTWCSLCRAGDLDLVHCTDAFVSIFANQGAGVFGARSTVVSSPLLVLSSMAVGDRKCCVA
jgi:hypothetical protein